MPFMIRYCKSSSLGSLCLIQSMVRSRHVLQCENLCRGGLFASAHQTLSRLEYCQPAKEFYYTHMVIQGRSRKRKGAAMETILENTSTASSSRKAPMESQARVISRVVCALGVKVISEIIPNMKSSCCCGVSHVQQHCGVLGCVWCPFGKKHRGCVNNVKDVRHTPRRMILPTGKIDSSRKDDDME